MIRLIINSNSYQNMNFYKKKTETIDFKVASFSPQRALEVAACQWHAFSNDRSRAEIEPVRVRPGLEPKIRGCKAR